MIPPPRFHTVRYHGVLAAHAKERADVVPEPAMKVGPKQLTLVVDGIQAPPETKPASRHPWAWLLRRVFAVDVMGCSRSGCRGQMKLVKIANEPDAIAQVLADVGLGPRPPPRSRPALPGQLELEFAA